MPLFYKLIKKKLCIRAYT